MEEPTYKDLLEQPGKIIIYRRFQTPKKPISKTQSRWGIRLLDPVKDSEFRHVCAAINLARRILCHDEAIKCMAEIGGQISQIINMEGAPILRENTQNSNQKWIKETFLPAVLGEFPPIYVDEQLDSPDSYAYSYSRRTMDVSAFGYQMSHVVLVNGDFVDKMVSAATRSHEDYRVFMWFLAHTLAHEVGGHLLTKYLTLGKGDTPVEVTGSGGPLSDKVGESGNSLEEALFGGEMWLYEDPARKEDYSQPGVPCFNVYRRDQDSVRQRSVRTINLDIRSEAFNFRKSSPLFF